MEDKNIINKVRKIKIPHLNLALLGATIGTTLIAGYMQSIPLTKIGVVKNPLLGAVAFSLGILAILGCHEMGHKLAAIKCGVKASFPYFIPAPTLIGTFGAIIKMETQPKDRNSLFDVGAAGPLGGILVAVPVTILGLLWSHTLPAGAVKGVSLPAPLLFQLLSSFLINPPENTEILLHPLAFAGWVGMLVTMLNLMPVGMLDGGHIVRALVGNRKLGKSLFFEISLFRIVSLLGAVITGFLGYWLMALLMIFFVRLDHPGPIDDTIPLSLGRKILGVGLLFLLVLCITPLWINFPG